MRVRALIAAIAVLTPLVGATSVPAQELATGTWTGTVTPPNNPTLDVEYEVSYDEEGMLQISLLPPASTGAPPSIPFRDIALEDGSLTFGWSAGVELTCELLLLDDGSFEGDCVDVEGVPGHLAMVPPM